MIGNHSIASPNLARSPSVNGEENDRKKKKQHEEKEKKHSKSLAFFFGSSPSLAWWPQIDVR